MRVFVALSIGCLASGTAWATSPCGRIPRCSYGTPVCTSDGWVCPDPPDDGGGGGGGGGGTTLTAVPSLPQGLTCEVWYTNDCFWPWDTCMYEGSTCRPAFDSTGNYDPATGYVMGSDGDFGMGAGDGFHHLEFSTGTTDQSVSARFALPKGTTCGFHHTRNTPGHTCMGFDPALGNCPAGWIAKKHFDMSSDTGYFAWCEYQDPNALCDGNCLVNALFNGYSCGMSSNTDSTGVGTCGGLFVNTQGCPAGAYHTPYFDDGRSSGYGLSWCHD